MAARSIIPVLPTIMTLGNLVCGFMAMAKTVDAMTSSTGAGPLDPAFAEKILQAAGLVLLGMIFDALDGRVARLTKSTSPFGAQVDSLADAVTFGVTPALMAKVVYEHGKIGLASLHAQGDLGPLRPVPDRRRPAPGPLHGQDRRRRGLPSHLRGAALPGRRGPDRGRCDLHL